jgi:hypothetical protein
MGKREEGGREVGSGKISGRRQNCLVSPSVVYQNVYARVGSPSLHVKRHIDKRDLFATRLDTMLTVFNSYSKIWK